jgi:hypothetical protein
MSERKTIEVKMARPTKDDFEAVFQLHRFLESLIEYQTITSGDEDDDSEVQVSSESEEYMENLSDFVTNWWERFSGSWNRVIFGGECAIQNACDPNASVLEFKPEIQLALQRMQQESDETAIDADWLKSVGFAKHRVEDLMIETNINQDCAGYLMDIAPMKTRGQLRTICRALGITLKEPTS